MAVWSTPYHSRRRCIGCRSRLWPLYPFWGPPGVNCLVTQETGTARVICSPIKFGDVLFSHCKDSLIGHNMGYLIKTTLSSTVLTEGERERPCYFVHSTMNGKMSRRSSQVCLLCRFIPQQPQDYSFSHNM